MKPWIAALLLALAGCSPSPVQDWKRNAASALDDYRRHQLSGDREAAAADYREALREIKRGGDVVLLGKTYLARCALEHATLEFGGCPDYQALAAGDQTPANSAYYRLLQLAPQAGDEVLVPAAYRELVSILLRSGSPDAAAVARIADPVSRLIACGLATKSGRTAAAVLELAIETAAYHGWKKAHLIYRERLAALQEGAGRLDEAQRLRRRNEVLQ